MLTPMELKSRQFQTTKKKYDKTDVDEFLALVYSNYEEAFENIQDLKKKIKTLSDGVQYYRSIESTLQKALILAEKTSKETKDAAILKAEAIEKDAHSKASKIVSEAETEYDAIKQQCTNLIQQFSQYKMQLRQAASAQLELINSDAFDIYTPELGGISTSKDFEHKSNNSDYNTHTVSESVAVTNELPEQTHQSSVPSPITFEEDSNENAVANDDTAVNEEMYSSEEETESSSDTLSEETAAPVSIDDLLETSPKNNTDSMDSTLIKSPKEAIVLEPIAAKPGEPIEAAVQTVKTTKTPQNQSLDSLLKDLNMNSDKSPTVSEEDPFEFLGSIDDF